MSDSECIENAAEDIHANTIGVVRTSLSAALVMATAACGGSGSESASAPSATPTSTPTSTSTVTLAETRASRFLGHATNGATRSDIDLVVDIGIEAWLDTQFLTPRSTSHWDWLVANGYSDASYATTPTLWDQSAWCQLISAEDQLRQRVAVTLLDTFVVSISSLRTNWSHFRMGHYMDTLLDHAFGNFRDMLSAITLTQAMGQFLTYLDSRKENARGEMPDENYARELMQLFTLGVYQRNQDGSLKTDADGNPLPTYSEQDVMQLARIFTGFIITPTIPITNPELSRADLIINQRYNETGSSTFLGSTVTGGGMEAVEAALDIIFAHANVAPFLALHLIQGLVTSNPSPQYINRVADVFSDNGNGVRGDMQAVVRAVLTDSEALSDANLTEPSFGKIRAPVQRFTNWARAFHASSASGLWLIETLEDRSTALGQSPGRAPSVFNFFEPDYIPSHNGLSSGGFVAPEFAIADEVTAIAYVNFMAQVVDKGLGNSDVVADYSDLEALADDPVALVDEVALRLSAWQLTSTALEVIRAGIEGISTTETGYALARAKAAVLLVLISPDYIAQR